MACGTNVGDINILFGKANAEITLQHWSDLQIQDSISEKGMTASFNAIIKPGEQMPETDSICLIRRVAASGFEHIFAGRYEVQAVTVKPGRDEYSFQIANFLDYTHRDWIEDYSLTRNFSDHIDNAMAESRAKLPGYTLTLLDLQPIADDDGELFKFEFKAGNLESFLNAICAQKKAKWKIKPVPFVSYAAKTTGSYALIEILIDGATSNRSVPGKLDPGTSHCGDVTYLSFIGEVKENRRLPVASRFTVNGRNGRKPVEPI